MNKKFKYAMALLALVIFGSSLTACAYDDVATPTSMCAFVVGDGEDGRDAKIDSIAYPGDVIDTKDDRLVPKYFPCNARNFIVNDGKQKNANGNTIGDDGTPTIAYTKDGTKVLIWWKAFFTVNQTKSVLVSSLYPFCYKYNCYSDDASDSGANYADKGWNGMLGENFSPAGDKVIFDGAKLDLSDASWKTRETTEWDALAATASTNFAAQIRPYTGVQDDLFCGSGNSGWKDPAKPGEGDFECSNVRFVVDNVVPYDSDLADNAELQKKADDDKLLNDKLLAAAKAKYGSNAEYWLGLQDSMLLCEEKVNCIVTFGGNGSPTVVLPQPTAAGE